VSYELSRYRKITTGILFEAAKKPSFLSLKVSI